MPRSRTLHALLTVLFVFVACAPAKTDAPRAPAGTATVSAVGDGGAAPVANETDDALRVRALAAIDAGDILAADKPLRELVRRHSDKSIGTRGLIAALESCALKDDLKNCALANVAPVEVSALPPPSTKPAPKTTAIVPRPLPRAPEPNRDAELFHFPRNPTWSLYRRGHMRGAPPPRPKGKPGSFPETYGGNDLVLLKWTGERALAVYGRGARDGRFVVVFDVEGKPQRVLDFRSWRAKNSLAEVGISEVDLIGDVLYVRQETNASDGYLAAVDTKTGKALWQSERIGMSTHFIAGEEHVVVWTYSNGGGERGKELPQGFKVLDRATGDVIARIPTPYVVFALVPKDGAIHAFGGGPGLASTNCVELKLATRTIAPFVEPKAPKEGVLKLATLPPSKDDAARLEVYKKLDAGNTIEALVELHTLFDRRPASLALEGLFAAAFADAAAQREQAARELTSLPGVARFSVVLPTSLKPTSAPIPRTRPTAPRLRLLEEKETRRHPAAWFMDAGIKPNTFEVDESPSGIPLFPAPGWLPHNRTEDVTNGAQTVAVFGNLMVAIYRSEKLTHLLDFQPSGDFGQIRFADAVGDVAVVSMTENRSGKGALFAIDLKTGKPLWRANDIAASSFVFVDGYIIASTDGLGKKPEIVVVEGDTGKVTSRSTSKEATPSFPNRLARDGTTLWAFNTITTGKWSIE